MALWDKLKTELDRAGRVAQSAFDEGKARLEIVRVRQLADRAAQALGYAVYNARKNGGDLDDETYQRLSTTLAAHEAEAQRLEAQMEAAKADRGDSTSGAATGASTPPPPADHVDPAMGDSGHTPGGSTGSSSGSSSGSTGTSGSTGSTGSTGGSGGYGGPYSGPGSSGGPTY